MKIINPDLTRLRDPRLIALKLAYSIPGYADADLETKNFIYDAIIKNVIMKGETTWQHTHTA